MIFKIPRRNGHQELASANFDFLMPITLNETSIERMLIQFLERCVKHGKTAPPRKASDFTELGGSLNLRKNLVPSLQKSDKFKNFDGEIGSSLLEGWIRTSLLEMIPLGRKKSDQEQIDYLRLLNVANYRVGLPTSNSRARHRRVDTMTYRVLLNFLVSKGADKPMDEIHHAVTTSSLASGVSFPEIERFWPEPKYDESTEIDINTLLELRFVELFTSSGVSRSKTDSEIQIPLELPIPEPFIDLASDFYAITKAYGKISSLELMQMYRSIFSIRLFQIPIRVGRNLSDLFDILEKPLNEVPVNKPAEMFFDFTNDPYSASTSLSNACVVRDLRLLNSYFDHSILLRETERCLRTIKSKSEIYDKLSQQEKLLFLMNNVDSDDVSMAAGLRIEGFISSLADSPEALAIIEDVKTESTNFLRALVELVLMDRRSDGLEGIRKWLKGVGGLRNQGVADSSSILKGTGKAHLWLYSMSDDVLNTLLNLCFLKENGEPRRRNVLEMETILTLLQERFGILIKSPPIGYDSAEFHKAADENFVAFTKRLKQLGWFEGLSDDFDAQYISRPKGF
ncbi:hypothetical protein MCEMZLE22_01072 [actinobacterium SCGC AAA044-D11]